MPKPLIPQRVRSDAQSARTRDGHCGRPLKEVGSLADQISTGFPVAADVDMKVGFVKFIAFRTENGCEPRARALVDVLQKAPFRRVLTPVRLH